jgi:hypothetical protein
MAIVEIIEWPLAIATNVDVERARLIQATLADRSRASHLER